MLVPGIRASFEVINNPSYYHKISKVFVDIKNKSLLADLSKYKNLPIVEKDKVALDRIYQNHQGIVVEVNYEILGEDALIAYLKKNSPPLLIMLDQINDPHNLGACIRSSEVLAGAPIIIPKDGSAPINETVAKTSAGAIFHTPIFVVNNLTRVLNLLKKEDYWSYVLDSNERSNSIYKTKFSGKTIIIMGSEEKGPQKILKENSDFSVYIPMRGAVDSLNVSVACGITIYEISKQLNSK